MSQLLDKLCSEIAQSLKKICKIWFKLFILLYSDVNKHSRGKLEPSCKASPTWLGEQISPKATQQATQFPPESCEKFPDIFYMSLNNYVHNAKRLNE